MKHRQWMTPPQLAKEWGVAPEKVIALIHSGELRAVNLALNKSGRPRWRIDSEDIRKFEEARASKPPATRRRRRRKRTTAESCREFF